MDGRGSFLFCIVALLATYLKDQGCLCQAPQNYFQSVKTKIKDFQFCSVVKPGKYNTELVALELDFA